MRTLIELLFRLILTAQSKAQTPVALTEEQALNMHRLNAALYQLGLHAAMEAARRNPDTQLN